MSKRNFPIISKNFYCFGTPYFMFKLFQGLTIQDLEDLLVDIKVYHLELEEGKNSDFWRDITIIAEEELNKLRKIDPSNTGYLI